MSDSDSDITENRSLLSIDSDYSEDEVVPKSHHEKLSMWAVCFWLGALVGVAIFIWCLLKEDFDYCLIIIAVGLYIAYLMEALCWGKACRYLSNVQSEEKFVEYIEALQQASPCITFRIQNYHYETRTKTVYRDGKRHTERTEERVNTHSASCTYPILSCTDETMSPSQTVAMFHLLHRSGKTLEESLHETVIHDKETGEKRLILTCKFPLSFHARDAATAEHKKAFAEQFYSSNTTDRHQDKSEKHDLSCWHTERAMVVLSSDGTAVTSKPCWMSRVWHVVSTILLFSLPFRYYVYRNTQKVNWQVRKHFSVFDPKTFTQDPISSLKHSSDPVLAKIAIMQDNAEGGFTDLPGLSSLGDEMIGLPLEAPSYWENKDLTATFDVVVEPSADVKEMVQQLLDKTFVVKSTRDRKGRMPSRLIVDVIQRVEDSELWKRYSAKCKQLASQRGPVTQLCDMDGSGEAKTSRFLGNHNSRLNSQINEMYLFHGSSPAGVLGIGESGFKLDLAGSNTGLMFGPGAYFAEASSKSDEYASQEASGLFAGKCALLLCRVACGELFRITESDKSSIQQAMASGEYDGVLGDREAAAGTYRELVVYEEAQVYPEYVVIYHRSFD